MILNCRAFLLSTPMQPARKGQPSGGLPLKLGALRSETSGTHLEKRYQKTSWGQQRSPPSPPQPEAPNLARVSCRGSSYQPETVVLCALNLLSCPEVLNISEINSGPRPCRLQPHRQSPVSTRTCASQGHALLWICSGHLEVFGCLSEEAEAASGAAVTKHHKVGG